MGDISLEPSVPMNLPCIYCGELVGFQDSVGQPIMNGVTGHWSYPHRECTLREVMGGIGHLRDHAYWCLERHDPDGGLSRRESARLVWQWVTLHGTEATAQRSIDQMGEPEP